jgi:hypothetical protein
VTQLLETVFPDDKKYQIPEWLLMIFSTFPVVCSIGEPAGLQLQGGVDD